MARCALLAADEVSGGEGFAQEDRMPELRWILIGFAIVLLACIYLWGRRGDEREPRSEGRSRGRPEPTLFGDELESDAPQFSSEFDDVVAASPAYPREYAGEGFDPDVTLERKVEAVRSSPAARYESAESAPRSAEPRVAEPRVPEIRRVRIEPTFLGDAGITAELPVEAEEALVAAADDDAPTLSSTDTPTPRRSDRRKILSLRLAAAPHRIEGAKLTEVFGAEGLTHGKYGIFHRLHDAESSVFCVASMVEPGTFDPEKMAQTQYTGITMFAQLPGPVPGMHALNELVACARRLQQSLGGTLQDDRGVPLTVHRIERLRQEVREFERPSPSSPRGAR
jgi:cell division protein ZipA